MTVTEDQIKEWKEKHGTVYMLETDDGKVGYISDPLNNLKTVKQAYAALVEVGKIGMAVSYLNNCWLGGDEELRKNEAYGNDLADKVDDIADLPDFTVTREKACYLIESEGDSIKVRAAKRADIIAAENRNAKREPFMTAFYILKAIAINKDDLKKLEENNRSLLGILRGVSEVKDKAYVAVKKL